MTSRSPVRTDSLDAQLAAAVGTLYPEARLRGFEQLQGGISARTFLVELDGAPSERLVIRCIGERVAREHPNAAAEEFAILRAAKEAGIAVPRPLSYDQFGAIIGSPYLVMEWIDGRPLLAPRDPSDCVMQMADQLSRIHAIGLDAFAGLGLPRIDQQVDTLLAHPPAIPDETIGETRIRNLLRATVPSPRNRPSVLHGDFWPGNLLWNENRLVAVIDWEDARIGDPLADLAISRLEVLWTFGIEPMHAFTARYAGRSGADLGDLPYWDLYAALRPASRLPEWAPAYVALRRPDMTIAHLQKAHRLFVDLAARALVARA